MEYLLALQNEPTFTVVAFHQTRGSRIGATETRVVLDLSLASTNAKFLSGLSRESASYGPRCCCSFSYSDDVLNHLTR